jgi:hypothetical protein
MIAENALCLWWKEMELSRRCSSCHGSAETKVAGGEVVDGRKLHNCNQRVGIIHAILTAPNRNNLGSSGSAVHAGRLLFATIRRFAHRSFEIKQHSTICGGVGMNHSRCICQPFSVVADNDWVTVVRRTKRASLTVVGCLCLVHLMST